MLLALVSISLAGTIPAWEVSSFGSSDGYLIGNSDWIGGFSSDQWYVYQGAAFTSTDLNVGEDYEGWGNDTAVDNWIVRGEDIGDVEVNVTWTNEDDDSTGLVTNHDGDRNFYLFLVTSGNAPPPGEASDRNTKAMLYRVSGGEAVVMAESNIDRIDGGDTFELGLTVDNGNLSATVDGDVVLEAADSSPLPPGMAGLYAYDTGYDGGWGNTSAYVTHISVAWIDEDNDSIADDVDNCEDVANADQADADGDQIGDLCDPTPGTGGDDSGGADDSGGGDSGGPPDNVVTLKGDCGCASGPSHPAVDALGLLALALGWRRRR